MREKRDECATEWGELEAIARAIEAEAAVDPVEAKARELREIAHPDAGLDWEALSVTAQGQYLRMARHVLGQEADQ